MAAPATAPRSGAKTAAPRRRAAAAPARSGTRSSASPARRAAPKRASSRRAAQPMPAPGRRVPTAVGRTATAVAALPDSGLVIRLTRGRLWIGALAALLVGIVALNVVSLNLSSSSSETARAVEELEREASALRGQLATELSSRRVQSVASSLGLVVPEPGSIRYLTPSDGDAGEAARRIRSGELTAAAEPADEIATALPETSAEPAVEAPVPIEPPAEGSP